MAFGKKNLRSNAVGTLVLSDEVDIQIDQMRVRRSGLRVDRAEGSNDKLAVAFFVLGLKGISVQVQFVQLGQLLQLRHLPNVRNLIRAEVQDLQGFKFEELAVDF